MLIPAVPSAPYTYEEFFLLKSSLQPIGPSILHAAWLGQTCVHCPIFPTAASRRSLVRVSVPVWGITLSGPLNIVALVSRYLTNKLMLRMPIFNRRNFKSQNRRFVNSMGY